MSHVCTLMLSVGYQPGGDGITLKKVNEWFTKEHGHTDRSGLKSLTDEPASEFWGGTKFPQADIWAAAINYLDIEEFMEYLASLPWRYPSQTQLFVKDEHDDRFAVYVLKGKDWQQVMDAQGSDW